MDQKSQNWSKFCLLKGPLSSSRFGSELVLLSGTVVVSASWGCELEPSSDDLLASLFQCPVHRNRSKVSEIQTGSQPATATDVKSQATNIVSTIPHNEAELMRCRKAGPAHDHPSRLLLEMVARA